MVDAGAQASLKLVPLFPQSPKVAEVIRRSMPPSSGTTRFFFLKERFFIPQLSTKALLVHLWRITDEV